MDMHRADFGVVAPYGDRFPGGVDELAFHRVPREVLGRDSNPAAPQRKVVARDATRWVVRHCVRCDAKRVARRELGALSVPDGRDASHPVPGPGKVVKGMRRPAVERPHRPAPSPPRGSAQ